VDSRGPQILDYLELTSRIRTHPGGDHALPTFRWRPKAKQQLGTEERRYGACHKEKEADSRFDRSEEGCDEEQQQGAGQEIEHSELGQAHGHLVP
jgi:hypothetical protein